MTVERVVDAHVHLWDPARADWYPYLAGMQELGMGDITGMCRRFDQPTYFAENARWNVEKFVHVAAAAPAVLVDETRELDEQAEATGHPDAIVGGVLTDDEPAAIERKLDEQMASARFRGVRVMGEGERAIPTREILGALAERDLLVELMVHPDGLTDAAAALDGWELPVVVEHTGWPRSNEPEERALWRDGMTVLAGLGDHVVCKLSGLAMPMGSIEVSVFSPWIDEAIELFGADRCMFASNFPVDGMHGSFDDLFGVYDAITAGVDTRDRAQLFAGTAERVYRC